MSDETTEEIERDYPKVQKIHWIAPPDLMSLKHRLNSALARFNPEDNADEVMAKSGIFRYTLYIPEDDVDGYESELYKKLMDAFGKAPRQFWISPSSRSHHPVDEQDIGGLVIHTNRVCAIAVELLDAFNIEQSSSDFSNTIAACLLHDILKGCHVEDNPNISNEAVWAENWKLSEDHPELCAEFLEHIGLPSIVCDAVRWHHGKWGNNSTDINLVNKVALITHLADKLASNEDLTMFRGWNPEPYLDFLNPWSKDD